MKRARWVASACALVVLSGGAATGIALRDDSGDSAGDRRGDGAHNAAKTAVTKTVVKPVASVGTTAGTPIPLPTGSGSAASDPARAARAHLKRYGAKFGVRDPQRQLKTAKTVKADGGQSIVRFQQVQAGLPVLGGELSVAVDAKGSLLSVNGETSRATVLRRPSKVTAAKARSIALGDTARREKRAASALVAMPAQAMLFDPALVGAPGLPVARKVWKVEVALRSGADVRQFVLVDAADGKVALTFNQRAHATAQVICDAGNTARPHENVCDGTALPYVYRPGNPAPAPGSDVHAAWTNIESTHDFFSSKVGLELTELLGYDSGDGAGKVLRSTVRQCVAGEPCPFQNAYWSSGLVGGQLRGQMFFGAGFAGADDVVAHELTHGVTETHANLLYYSQAGAINESLSDVFGELTDLSNGIGDDADAQRWKLGEELPAPIGAIRDMRDPTVFEQPDRMTSGLWKSYWNDNGGVHQNSGVGNKAAYLITDGGSFNGRTMTGLGIAKAAKIYYRVEQTLTTGADYAQLYRVLPQACNDLVGVTTSDGPITTADCAQVQTAVDATEMNRVPVTEATPAAAPAGCPTAGDHKLDLAFDDFEPGTSPAGFSWVTSTPPWTEVKDYTLPVAGEQNGYQLFGPDPLTARDFAHTMATGVKVPSGVKTYARFNHAYAFDWQDPTEPGFERAFFDGGFVEVSADGGAWLPATFINNGPSSPIEAAARRTGFGGDSLGWMSSRIDLSAFAGKTVKLRFRIVSDSEIPASAGIGWWVDNFRIFGCGSATPGIPTGVSAVGNAGLATVRWTPPIWTGNGPITGFQVKTYPTGTTVTLPPTATSTVITGLANGTHYSFGVRAVSAGGVGAEARTATLSGTSLLMTASPAALVYGSKLTFSGRLVRAGTSTGIGNSVISIVHRPKGTTTWLWLINTRTNATGNYAVAVTPVVNSEYMARFSSGSTVMMGSTSPVRTALVTYLVTATPSTTQPAAGALVNITGLGRPLRTGKAVQLQRYIGGRWVVINSTTLASSGTYLFRQGFTRGSWILRTAIPADQYNVAGFSKVFTLTVS